MTPKEKAIELVDIYKDINTTWIFNGTITTNVVNYDLAKNCALVAIDVMTKYIPNVYHNDIYKEKYWKQVKKEIEKL